jgi:hypothetical protein
MTENSVQSLHTSAQEPGLREAWQIVLGRLRPEMSKALFETWVEPLRPLSYREGVVTIGAVNPYGRDWVESRLKSSLSRLLAGVYNAPLSVQVVVDNSFAIDKAEDSDPTPAPVSGDPPQESEPDSVPESSAGESSRRENSPRKIMLQRAYGNRRAAVVQPERGMFLTLYYFNNWLPLLGHSAATIILAARSMCYWNPLTGELRNTVETDMAELAHRAAVSVRTVKDVLAQDLVQRYFLRYVVRRMMTPNGVRTAGITLQVRMDDPLTPTDQEEYNLPENERWYSAEFSRENDED